MPTLAIAAYGSSLRIGDGVPLTALTVTTASNTTPILITTSVAHGISDVSVVTVSGVLGNTGANGTFVAARTSATQLSLRGSAGTGAYTSGGSLVRTETFATVAEVTAMDDAGLTTTLAECSALDGAGYGSQIPVGLVNNTLRLRLNLVPDHPTHNELTGLVFLQLTKAKRHFLLVLSDAAKTAWWVTGYVSQFKVGPMTPTSVLTAEAMVGMTDAPILSVA